MKIDNFTRKNLLILIGKETDPEPEETISILSKDCKTIDIKPEWDRIAINEDNRKITEEQK